MQQSPPQILQKKKKTYNNDHKFLSCLQLYSSELSFVCIQKVLWEKNMDLGEIFSVPLS